MLPFWNLSQSVRSRLACSALTDGGAAHYAVNSSMSMPMRRFRAPILGTIGYERTIVTPVGGTAKRHRREHFCECAPPYYFPVLSSRGDGGGALNTYRYQPLIGTIGQYFIAMSASPIA